MNDEAADLTRLRKWAFHPGNENNPLASAVRLLFKRVDKLVDKVASAEQAILDVKIAEAAARVWQKKCQQLRALFYNPDTSDEIPE